MNYYITKVLKLRKCTRVFFSNEWQTVSIDFSNKYGQHRTFVTEMKRNEKYPSEWVHAYLIA